VCLYICLFVPRRIPILLHGPGCNLGECRGCPLVVQCWADLRSVHGFRCYDNTHVCKIIALYTANAYSAECEMSASACTHSMAGVKSCLHLVLVIKPVIFLLISLSYALSKTVTVRK